MTYKGFIGEPPAVDGRTVELYAATFGDVPDSVGDVLAPGAADETIGRGVRDVKLFLQHQVVLGPLQVLEQRQAPSGHLALYARGTVTNDPEFDPYLAQIADGTYAAASIGFVVKAVASEAEVEEMRKVPGWENTLRIITDADIMEVSAVLRGANPNAAVAGVKAAAGIDVDAIAERAAGIAAAEVRAALDRERQIRALRARIASMR